MSLFKKIQKSMADDGILFNVYLTELNPNLRQTELVELYENAINLEIKVLSTIINSILTQQQVYFCISRDRLDVLFSKDWPSEKIYHRNYKLIFRLLTNCGLFSLVKSKVTNRPALFKVVDAEILSKIHLDYNAAYVQLEKCLTYLKQNNDQKLIDIEKKFINSIWPYQNDNM